MKTEVTRNIGSNHLNLSYCDLAYTVASQYLLRLITVSEKSSQEFIFTYKFNSSHLNKPGLEAVSYLTAFQTVTL